MPRIAFLLGIADDSPATVAEYQARHDAIWPEMSEMLVAAGMRNYSIYRLGTQLFAYCEVDDWAETQRRIAASTVNTRWQAYMADILRFPLNPTTAQPYLLEEMFHLDDGMAAPHHPETSQL